MQNFFVVFQLFLFFKKLTNTLYKNKIIINVHLINFLLKFNEETKRTNV